MIKVLSEIRNIYKYVTTKKEATPLLFLLFYILISLNILH